jgi:hypothetical protein
MSHRRIARARAWLTARAPAEEVLIIGANLDGANELARGVAQKTGAAFGWHRMTLAQSAAMLAAPIMTERGIASIGSLGVEAIVCRAVQALGSGGALGRYACIAEGPGFSRAIAGVLIEMRLAGIAHEVLGDLAPDLLRLLRAYESELQQANLTDWAGMLAIATETAAEPSPDAPRWVCLPMLLLDVPITSKAELAFIAALCSAAPEMLATVPAADEPTLALLRGKLQFDIEDLDEPGSVLDGGDRHPGSLARLQKGSRLSGSPSICRSARCRPRCPGGHRRKRCHGASAGSRPTRSAVRPDLPKRATSRSRWRLPMRLRLAITKAR